ncbi:probable membrane-associated kinase regulator 4 [Henckelia pumila]|uniref:probable membrane-associated kinase regulator 4 n=1 Tax=Henckelia pumila TaxID=405737 RepID=UPI003C6E39CF
MAINLALYECEDEDYIEMEMTSSPSNPLHVSANSCQEFEFQMPSTSNNTHSTISTADELFYNGKILPLHLTLRRKMVQNLLHHHQTAAAAAVETAKQPAEKDSNHFTILPLDSCRESCELDHDDCLFEWPVEFTGFMNNHPTKRSWSKKLKLIKSSILVQKLKFFFNKSACTDESSPCAKANPNPEPQNWPKTEDCSSKHTTFSKKKPFGFIGKDTNQTADAVTKINIDKGIEENMCRKSVSDQNSPAKLLSSSSCSSSSSSSSVLKRSSSATEIEGSIEAAIDHCKNSQQILDKFLDCYCIDL